eukprot:scaffold48210_cov35-Phaeocystis_antarctica.AAC.2
MWHGATCSNSVRLRQASEQIAQISSSRQGINCELRVMQIVDSNVDRSRKIKANNCYEEGDNKRNKKNDERAKLSQRALYPRRARNKDTTAEKWQQLVIQICNEKKRKGCEYNGEERFTRTLTRTR